VGTSGSSSGQVTATVAPTTLTATRWGRITIGAATALVVQDGLAGNVTVTPASATAPAAGAVGEFAVSTNASDYQWSYTVNDSWIQSVALSQLSTVGPGTLRYIVAENPDTAAVHRPPRGRLALRRPQPAHIRAQAGRGRSIARRLPGRAACGGRFGDHRHDRIGVMESHQRCVDRPRRDELG
jgi:hypothetical protein